MDILEAYNNTEYTFCDNKTATYKDIFEIFLQFKRLGKKKIFFIGNGGSAGIAQHMTADFLKNGGIRTHSMLESTIITCLGNDFGYEYIFSKQLELVADEGDLLVAISSSGNSPNIINGAMIAKEVGCKVVTFTGFKEDNKLRKIGDVNIYVPSMSYGYVESIHNKILQQIVDDIVDVDGIGMRL